MGTRLRVGLAVGIALATATEAFAYLARLDPALGPPLWRHGWLAVYGPWRIAQWAWWWGSAAPQAFTVPGLVALLSAGLTLVQCLPKRQRTRQAHWATDQEVVMAQCRGKEGIVLGIHRRRILRYHGAGHTIFIGRTRSGKTASFISTVLEYPHSLLIYDPKDGVYPKTAGYRAQRGPVVRLAPLEATTDHYNPWSAVRLGTDDTFRDVEMISQYLTNPDGKANRDDTTEHFQELVNQFFCGVFIYGLSTGLARCGAEFNDLVNLTPWEDLLQAMAEHEHPEVQRAASIARRPAERELGSMQTTAARALRIFSDPRIAAMTGDNSFALTDLREAPEPCTVYLTVPFDDQQRLRPLTRLILRQLIGYATSRLGGWTQKLLVAIDELPSLDKLAIISDALNFAAEYGVQLLLLTPSMKELERLYGRTHNFLEGTYVQAVFGLNDPEVAQYFARRVGKYEHVHRRITRQSRGGRSRSEDPRQEDLISTTGVLLVPETDVLIVAGEASIVAHQARYYQQSPWVARSLLPVPTREREG